MGELRKDYVLDRWVIIAEIRGKRPHELVEPQQEVPKTDVFSPENEHLCAEEIGRFPANGEWQIRWVENKFPAVTPDGNPSIKQDGYYGYSANYGYHEVIIETRDSIQQMWDFSWQHIRNILLIYAERLTELNSRSGIAYSQIFKNSGVKAGTSIFHSHTQVIAYNKIPSIITQEVAGNERYGRCVYCDVLAIEMRGERRVFENQNFVSFTPYASSHPLEIWVFPRRHIQSIADMNPEEFDDLAQMMSNILARLKTINASFNYYLHCAPKGHDLHFHIEITPRISIYAGFEIGTGDIINSITPENAAKFYRCEL